MKKKINTFLLLTVLLTLMATLMTAVAIFHSIYQRQVKEELRTQAELISCLAYTQEEIEEEYSQTITNLRVTLIDPDGTVVYDSQTDASQMGNHRNREEVKEALDTGEGFVIRHSDTLDNSMYYYALRLNDGTILRIGREEANVWSFFTSTLRPIICVAAVMIAVCMLLSHYITKEIVRPIERMAADIDSVNASDTYEELVPFVKTVQKQHEDIIKGAKMRQEFTANVSHELKTPLTAISGYAELIETGLAGENEVQRFATEIQRNSKRLLTLIDDIIRLSELDSDRMEIKFSDVDLCEAARACTEMVRMNAERHGIRISCSAEPCIIKGDKEMIEEVIYNLCDNAIRYNRLGGSVEVIVGTRNGHGMLCVRDTGIGIPKESQERVFERFYRVDKSRSKNTGGTGLGLAIVKHIVAQHHAHLELKSEVGKGTEITVWF